MDVRLVLIIIPLSTNPFLLSLFFFFTSSHRFGAVARTDGAYILSLALLFFFSIQKGSVSHPACVQSRGGQTDFPTGRRKKKWKFPRKQAVAQKSLYKILYWEIEFDRFFVSCIFKIPFGE
jgi:hypothetical protein